MWVTMTERFALQIAGINIHIVPHVSDVQIHSAVKQVFIYSSVSFCLGLMAISCPGKTLREHGIIVSK